MNREDIKAIAKDIGLPPQIYAHPGVIDLIRRATQAEREACARLESEMALSPAHFATMAEWRAYREGVEEYTVAIRARGNK